ncbi:MAG: hypothetical protein ACRDTH_14010 [Pseudonocardiaceae bacterium]
MSPPACGNCERPVADGAAICITCADSLAVALRRVPDLLENLLVTYAKQDKLSAGGKRGKQAEPPLPARLDISRVIDAVCNEMTTWARVLVDHHGWDVPNPPRRRPRNGQRGVVFPVSSPKVDLACYAAEWLAEHVGHLRMHPAALEAHRSITAAIEAAELAIDRRPSQAYLGPCEKCDTDLGAATNAATVTCWRCGKTYDGPTLRAQLLKNASDQLVTAAELSAALTALSGVSVPIGTIRSWRSRGQIAPHAWLHDRDRPLFRVGDAVKLLDSRRPT